MANNAVGTESFATEEKREVGKKLRWAIVGCGGISTTHLDAIKQIPEIEVVAGCDIKPDRLKLMNEKYGIKATYEKWDDLLAEIKPDVVDVCTPNGVHMPAAVAAMDRCSRASGSRVFRATWMLSRMRWMALRAWVSVRVWAMRDT